MFSTMVSPKVLEMMEVAPDSVSLGGSEVEATIFFSDIQGFTTMSERLTSADQVEFTNSYMTAVTEAILAHDGYVDKFLGDGVMAVWGAPVADEDHVEKACRCALAQQVVIREQHDAWLARYGVDIVVRMGVHCGTVTAVNMGSSAKFEYTVMGDSVNLAARLEPSNKDYGTSVIVSESVANGLPEAFVLRRLDQIRNFWGHHS